MTTTEAAHQRKVLDLDVNHRSGADAWYSMSITSCRRGTLHLEDWRFLHGAPTTHCGSWLTDGERSECGHLDCDAIEERSIQLRGLTAHEWQKKICDLECAICQQNRQSRCRVFQPLSEDFLALKCNLGDVLRSDHFKGALYITKCNEPAAAYTIARAQNFAVASREQILWVQAEDFLNDVHFSEMSSDEKMKKKEGWLQANYHAKRTGEVPSLLPLIYNLPMRMLRGEYGGQQTSLKEAGVHNQGRCLLKAWELHDCDLDLVKQSPSESIVLTSLPKRLAIFIQRRDDDEQLKDCAENWVWLPAVSTTWFLDKPTKTIEIPRRGFAIVPDFASTIHGATGRTLPSAIIDIGAFKSKANPNGAMEGMIGMSRVKRKEHVVIARPFPPGLFRQGPAVFPTLLLTVLNGHVRCEDLDERLKDADDELQQMQAKIHHRSGTCRPRKSLPACEVRPPQVLGLQARSSMSSE
jgi:hypothetical protein